MNRGIIHFLSMETAIVSVNGVSKSFGQKKVLDSIDWTLDAGTVYGLVGLNGAGKTTLIRLLLGLLKPDTGSIDVLGSNPWRHEPSYYTAVGAVLEHDGFRGNCTFDENIRFFAQARGLSPKDLSAYLDEVWETAHFRDGTKKVKHFSRGERMQCALCRAFLGWPKVCFLDEPTVALDMDAFDHFCSLVTGAKQRGATILISSHHIEAVEVLCDRIAVLKDSKLTDISEPVKKAHQWILRTDGNPEYGETIHRITGTKPSYRNGRWHFIPANPDREIPALVCRLVAQGCSVHEIKCLDTAFRESVKKAFEG
ncbi:MAG: ATP-binding cassette domain-containing protein [Chitinivibrionales bacterium]|nr:ATP-binding cassette domain-containing protein [Chitinivibrionales bacterium]